MTNTRATFIEFPIGGNPADVDPHFHTRQIVAAVVTATERDLMACRQDVDQKTVYLARLEDTEAELLQVANAVRRIHGLLPIEPRPRTVGTELVT